MKYRTLKVVFMLTAWSVACGVSAADNTPRSRPVDETTFKTLDIDGDGYVSRMEVRRDTYLERHFDQLDTNRDGRLSREELRGMFKVQTPGDSTNKAVTR